MVNIGDDSTNGEPFDLAGTIRKIGVIDFGAYEALQVGTGDADADGMSDAFEMLHTTPPSPISLVASNDEDDDGLTNLLEFGVGFNPTVYDTEDAFISGTEDVEGTTYFTLTYRQNLDAVPFNVFAVERSTDVGTEDNWSTNETVPVPPSSTNGNIETIKVRSLFAKSGLSREMLRLSIAPTTATTP